MKMPGIRDATGEEIARSLVRICKAGARVCIAFVRSHISCGVWITNRAAGKKAEHMGGALQ
jgi:hypothetical protein